MKASTLASTVSLQSALRNRQLILESRCEWLLSNFDQGVSIYSELYEYTFCIDDKMTAAVEWGYFMRDGHSYTNTSKNRPFRITKAYVKDNASHLDFGTSVEIRVANSKTGTSFPLCVLNKVKPMTSIDLEFEQEADLVFQKITTGKLVGDGCPNLLGIRLEGYYLDRRCVKPPPKRCAAWMEVQAQMKKMKCEVEKVFNDGKEIEEGESEEAMKILKSENGFKKEIVDMMRNLEERMLKMVQEKNQKMKDASKILGTVKEEFGNLEKKIGTLVMEDCFDM